MPSAGPNWPPTRLEGLCPGCLLKRGLESQTGVTGATAGKGDSPRPSFARCPPGRPSGCFAQMGTVPFSEADYLPPTPAELAPYFPDLEILELVGRGGMGVVYKARQKRLDRLVALKILSPKIGREPAFAERFQREAQAMALLNHPHIVVVHDFGQTSAVAQASSLLAASGEPGRSSSPLPPGENDRDNSSLSRRERVRVRAANLCPLSPRPSPLIPSTTSSWSSSTA